MRGGVIGLGPAAAASIHLGLDGVPHGEMTAFHPSGMHEHIATAIHGVDGQDHVDTTERSAIADLTAAFAIEGCAVEHHLHDISGRRR